MKALLFLWHFQNHKIMDEFMERIECHYCGEHVDELDTECPQWGSFLGQMVKSTHLFYILLAIGGWFALYTIWVGYKLFL